VDPFGEQHPGRGRVRRHGPAPFVLGQLPVRRATGHLLLPGGNGDGPGPRRHPELVLGLAAGARLLCEAPIEPAVPDLAGVVDPGHHYMHVVLAVPDRDPAVPVEPHPRREPCAASAHSASPITRSPGADRSEACHTGG